MTPSALSSFVVLPLLPLCVWEITFPGKLLREKTDGGHNYNTGRGQQRVSSVTISNNKIVFCYNSLIGRWLGKMYEIMWHQMKWKCTCPVCCREKNIWRYWIGKKMHWINTMNQIGFHKTDAFDRLKRVQYFIPFLKISQSNFCLPFVPELNKNSWCWQKTPDILKRFWQIWECLNTLDDNGSDNATLPHVCGTIGVERVTDVKYNIHCAIGCSTKRHVWHIWSSQHVGRPLQWSANMQHALCIVKITWSRGGLDYYRRLHFFRTCLASIPYSRDQWASAMVWSSTAALYNYIMTQHCSSTRRFTTF